MKENNIWIVYKITSKHNNKCYIGSSTKGIRREKEHLADLIRGNHANRHLQNHANKHGIEDLIFEIIEVVEQHKKQILLSREQFYIDTINPQFNIAKIAGSCLGMKHPIESIERGRQKRIGRKASEETKQKMSESMKGKNKWNEDQRKVLSERNIGKKLSEETKQKLREIKTGTKASEETKRKISEKSKGEKNPMYGKPITDEHRENLRISHLGKQSRLGIPNSEQARKKISDSNKGKKPSEETLKKRSESMMGKNQWNEEQRKAISERKKKEHAERKKGTFKNKKIKNEL